METNGKPEPLIEGGMKANIKDTANPAGTQSVPPPPGGSKNRIQVCFVLSLSGEPVHAFAGARETAWVCRTRYGLRELHRWMDLEQNMDGISDGSITQWTHAGLTYSILCVPFTG